MTGNEATALVIDALELTRIPYMVVGSFSSNLYGIPRSTKDADFVLELGDHSIYELVRGLGPSFSFDPQLSFESVTATQRHVLRLVDSVFSVELFYLSEDAHDQERFRRRRRARLLDRETWVPTPEDVIVVKLRWSLGSQRGKDVDDVKDVIAVQGGRLDWGYVQHWCDRHGTRSIVDQLRRITSVIVE